MIKAVKVMTKTNVTNNMIPLVEDYYFSADENQYILYRCGKRNKIDIKTKKSTNEIIYFTKTVGFYATLSAMLKGCIRECNMRKVQNGDVTSLSEYIKRLEEMYNRIEKLTKGY